MGVGQPDSHLLKWSDRLKALPEPIAYIVLDNDVPPNTVHVERDGKGRRYIHTTPAVMDEFKHETVQVGPIDFKIASHDLLPRSLTGIPVYRREDLSADWPWPEEWLAGREDIQ